MLQKFHSSPFLLPIFPAPSSFTPNRFLKISQRFEQFSHAFLQLLQFFNRIFGLPSGRLHGRLHNRALAGFNAMQICFESWGVGKYGGLCLKNGAWSLELRAPVIFYWRVFSLNWSLLPGDSSRDLFIPKRWRSLNHWKGSRELTIPKRSPAELPGWGFFVETPFALKPHGNFWLIHYVVLTLKMSGPYKGHITLPIPNKAL